MLQTLLHFPSTSFCVFVSFFPFLLIFSSRPNSFHSSPSCSFPSPFYSSSFSFLLLLCLPLLVIPSPIRGWDLVVVRFGCTLLLLSHPPIGDGILFFPGFMYTIIIIPSPNRGWDLVLAWFHLHYYYYPIPR